MTRAIRLPELPPLISPGMLREPILQDDHRQTFDRRNALLLLEGIRPDTVFIGDSLTADWPVESLFSDILGLVVNRALGGDAVRYVHRRLDADAFQLRPRNLFFMIGTNDIAFRFGYDTDDAIYERMMADFETCFEMIQATGIRTYAAPIPPVRQTLIHDVLYDRKKVLIPRVNTALRAAISDHGFILVDHYEALCDADGMLAAPLTTDGTHFSALGYWVLNRVTRSTLADHPPAR